MTAALEIRSLVKHFAGLTATDNVSLSLTTGQIHALIGPNGAGKSTLINQLAGTLTPDSGRIYLQGRDITGCHPAERVRLGLGRTFQVTNLLGEFTVRENLAIAVQARRGRTMRILDRFSGAEDIWQETDAALSGTALMERATTVVDDLSHGERKQLELLVALVGKPKVLLLDEPMAGLGHAESQDMIQALRKLGGQVTILLVEHDMEAVFALADEISVLVYGKLVMTGTADAVSNSKEVQEAYLGSEDIPC